MKTRRRLKRRLWIEELESRLTPSTVTSTNWSGYAVTAPKGAVTDVVGSWVVPSIQSPAGSKSAGIIRSWVGIDGYSSSTVEQIGTDSDIVNGVPQYFAWYEFYPNDLVLREDWNTTKPNHGQETTANSAPCVDEVAA